MRDVSPKVSTKRSAESTALLTTSARVPELLDFALADKGDALVIARIAGIQAAKNTWSMIPLCHQIPILHAEVYFDVTEHSIGIRAVATTLAETGVEMETLAAAGLAALTLYDILKPHADDMKIGEIELLSKTGGKSDLRGLKEDRARACVFFEDDFSDIAQAWGERLQPWAQTTTQPIESTLNEGQIAQSCVDACTNSGATHGFVFASTATAAHIVSAFDRGIPGAGERLRGYLGKRQRASMFARCEAGVVDGRLLVVMPTDSELLDACEVSLLPDLLMPEGLL